QIRHDGGRPDPTGELVLVEQRAVEVPDEQQAIPRDDDFVLAVAVQVGHRGRTQPPLVPTVEQGREQDGLAHVLRTALGLAARRGEIPHRLAADREGTSPARAATAARRAAARRAGTRLLRSALGAAGAREQRPDHHTSEPQGRRRPRGPPFTSAPSRGVAPGVAPTLAPTQALRHPLRIPRSSRLPHDGRARRDLEPCPSKPCPSKPCPSKPCPSKPCPSKPCPSKPCTF